MDRDNPPRSASLGNNSRAAVTCSTDWWAFSGILTRLAGIRCTVVWQATRIPTTATHYHIEVDSSS